MGCFSSKCLVCGEGVNSNSFIGELVELFLLKDGEVIQHMSGEYDSYGRVFIDGTQDPDVKHSLRESEYWNLEWRDVCNLIFNDKSEDGLAYVHTNCWDRTWAPTVQSEDDYDQGWNRLKEKHLPKNIDGTCKYPELLEQYENEDLEAEMEENYNDYFEEYEEFDEDED